MEGVRTLVEPLSPRTVQDWFIDGLDVLDIWVDVPAEVADSLLSKLLEDLRHHLASSFSAFRPSYGCSLILSREEHAFGSVHLDHRHPEQARILVNE